MIQQTFAKEQGLKKRFLFIFGDRCDRLLESVDFRGVWLREFGPHLLGLHWNLKITQLKSGTSSWTHPPSISIIFLCSTCHFPGFVLRIWMECETAVATLQLASQHPRPRQMPLTGQYGRQGWDPHVVDTIRPQMPGYRAFFPGKKLLAWRDEILRISLRIRWFLNFRGWIWGTFFVKSTWKIYGGMNT